MHAHSSLPKHPWDQLHIGRRLDSTGSRAAAASLQELARIREYPMSRSRSARYQCTPGSNARLV